MGFYILDGKNPIPCSDISQLNNCTWDEAEEGHRLACELVNKKGIDRENKLNDLGI